MDHEDLRSWVGEYWDTFAACARGEGEVESLLAYYGVPLIRTSDEQTLLMTSSADVIEHMRRQIDGLLATQYDHTDALDVNIRVLNATSALYETAMSRHRPDGSELSRFRVTYLVIDRPTGRRISAIVVHSAA